MSCSDLKWRDKVMKIAPANQITPTRRTLVCCKTIHQTTPAAVTATPMMADNEKREAIGKK